MLVHKRWPQHGRSRPVDKRLLGANFGGSVARVFHVATPPSPLGPELIAEALRGARAPGVSLLVIVTARAADDEALDTIRRSGTPYVIVQAPALACLPKEGALKGRRVLVPVQGGPAITALPVTLLVDQILRALTEEELQGRTIALGALDPVRWVELLRRQGARPLLARPFWIRIGRWFGQLDLAALLAGSQASALTRFRRPPLASWWQITKGKQRPPCLPAAA